LKHPWFSGKESKENLNEASVEAFSNFRKFSAEAKIQQAALAFIVN
jgi:hypothetical protein